MTRHPPGPYHVSPNSDNTADLLWDVMAEATFWDAGRALQIATALNRIVRSQHIIESTIDRLTHHKPSRKTRHDLLRLLTLALHSLEEGRSAQVYQVNGRKPHAEL